MDGWMGGRMHGQAGGQSGRCGSRDQPTHLPVTPAVSRLPATHHRHPVPALTWE